MTRPTEVLTPQGGGQNAAQNQEPLSIIHTFLDFIERHMRDFPLTIQILITITILGLLVVYVLNGFVAATFVKAQLFTVIDGQRDGHPKNWKVRLQGGEDTTPNDAGYVFLPLYRSGIPGKIRIEFESEDRKPIAEYSWWGPWPVVNAIWPIDKVFDIDPQKKAIVKISDASETVPLLDWPWTSVAQASQEAPRSQKSPLPGGAAPPDSNLNYQIVINSVTVEKLPGFFRSTGRFFFRLMVDDKPIDIENSRAFSFAQNAVQQASPLRFPSASSKDSWLPINTGDTARYSGLSADISSAVTTKGLPPNAQVIPKGKIVLEMVLDNGEKIGSFDLTDAAKAPGTFRMLPSVEGTKSTISVTPQFFKRSVILNLQRIEVREDGSAGSTHWQFSVFVNGIPTLILPESEYNAGKGKNVVVWERAVRADSYSRILQIRVEGGQTHKKDVRASGESELSIPAARSIEVKNTDPKKGSFVFHFSATS